MKMWLQVLLVGSFFLYGCNQSTSVPTVATLNPIDTATTSPSPVQTETAIFTPTAETAPTPAVDQEALKDEWGSAINNAIILSSTCEWMFETYMTFQEGEIDLQKANSQLSLEADFVSRTDWDLPEAYENEVAAAFMLTLETQMGGLIELIDTTNNNKIESSEALDTLYPVCGSLFDLLSEIVHAAMEAGLTEESVNEIDVSRTDMYKDFYGMIFGES